MKKRIVLLILCLVAVASVGLVGCSENHKHTFSEDWEHNETFHWHAATCEHKDQTSSKEEHIFETTGLRLCVKCGYSKADGNTYKEVNGIRYKLLDDGTYELEKVLRSIETFDVPEEVEGRAVTGIGTGAFVDVDGNNIYTTIKNLTIPDSVTYIAARAFASCKLLESIKMSSNITKMGEYAFDGCVALAEIKLPDSLKEIPYGTFSGCEKLQKAELGSETIKIGGYAFDSCTMLEDITLPSKIASIGESAFFKCASLKNIVIPDSVLEVGSSAFQQCTGLSSVKLGGGIKSLGAKAFSGCSKLSGAITVPDGVTAIEDETFYQCSSITEVSMGDEIKSIGDNAFRECSELNNIAISNKVKSIGDYAFYKCGKLENVTFGSELETIGLQAFASCSKLKNFVLGDSLTEINDYAFEDCTSLTEVVLPKKAEYLGAGILAGCNNIKTLTLPYVGSTRIDNSCIGYFFDNLPDVHTSAQSKNSTLPRLLQTINVTTATSIGESAFLKCDNLKTLTLPDSVLVIGASAFSNSANLSFNDEEGLRYIGSASNPHLILVKATDKTKETYDINENTKIIMDSAFDDCASLTSIEIPDSVVSVGNKAFNKCVLLEKTSDDNGLLYVGNKSNPYKVLLSAGACKTEQIDVNEKTEIIAGGAFYVHSTIKQITIPSNIKSIGNSAFYGCEKLSKVILPESVTILGSSVFASCNMLTDVTISGNIQGALSNLFSKSYNIRKAAVNAVLLPTLPKGDLEHKYSLEEINVVSGETIDNSALENCLTLKTLTIGNSVKRIGHGAFQNCAYLQDVTLSSELVSIGDYAFYSCGSLKGNLVLADSLVSVGENAFYLTQFTSLKIGRSLKTVGRGAFGYMDIDVMEVSAENDNFTFVDDCLIDKQSKVLVLGTRHAVIPTDGSVVEIGDFALYNRSNLRSLTIPVSVVKIGDGALANIRNLEIIYQGTIAQWNAIEKGIDWNLASGDETTNEVLIRCTDGNVVESGV